MCIYMIIDSNFGVAWKLKNDIPNAHVLDQVQIIYVNQRKIN